jgi:hypothetical protein
VYHAIAATALRRADKSTSSAQRASAEADSAIALLRQAVAAGYRDWGYIKAERAFGELCRFCSVLTAVHSIVADSAKTYGNLALETACRNTDEFPEPDTAALIVGWAVSTHPKHNCGISRDSRSGILITEIKTPETRRIEGLRDWGLLRANDLMNRWNFASGPG